MWAMFLIFKIFWKLLRWGDTCALWWNKSMMVIHSFWISVFIQSFWPEIKRSNYQEGTPLMIASEITVKPRNWKPDCFMGRKKNLLGEQIARLPPRIEDSYLVVEQADFMWYSVGCNLWVDSGCSDLLETRYPFPR